MIFTGRAFGGDGVGDRPCAQGLDLLRGDDPTHAGVGANGRQIDCSEACMRMHGADHKRVQRARVMVVCREAPLACDQGQIFLPRGRETGVHAVFSCSVFAASLTDSTIWM